MNMREVYFGKYDRSLVARSTTSIHLDATEIWVSTGAEELQRRFDRATLNKLGSQRIVKKSCQIAHVSYSPIILLIKSDHSKFQKILVLRLGPAC